MKNNPHSKRFDFAAIGLALFFVGVAGFLACHAILAISRPYATFDNKAEVSP